MKNDWRNNLVIVIFFLGVAGVWYYSSDQSILSSRSDYIEDFQQVDDYPLYVARYVNDYKFEEYLQTGQRPQLKGFGCTCFVDGFIVGRNFDFPENPALLLFTAPEDGYKSVSMVDLGYFEYSLSNIPVDPVGLEETPYMPFDGMNEKGLVVTMAAIPFADAPISSDKVSIGEIAVIRLLLDYAADVDEAIELLDEYNVVMTDPPIHYLIADANGESAIIEFLDNEMMVYRSNESQIITNFLVTGLNLPLESPCRRYNSVFSDISSENGKLSSDNVFQILDDSSQSSTIWSIVYDIENLSIQISMGREYSNVISFMLG